VQSSRILTIDLLIKRLDFKSSVSLLVITVAGFYTKFYTGPATGWVRNSLGGALYEIFWCILAAIFFRKTNPWKIAATVFIITSVLECLQLWHPPFLEFIRGYFIGRTLIGTTFAWSDFFYYILGSGIGWLWIKILRKEG